MVTANTGGLPHMVAMTKFDSLSAVRIAIALSLLVAFVQVHLVSASSIKAAFPMYSVTAIPQMYSVPNDAISGQPLNNDGLRGRNAGCDGSRSDE